MEVERKPMSGCMKVFVNIFLGIASVGIIPIVKWANDRKWPKSLDEQGLVTHGGKRIAWNEFTKVIEVIALNKATKETLVHHELVSRKGKVPLDTDALVNGQQVSDYIFQHLPAEAKENYQVITKKF